MPTYIITAHIEFPSKSQPIQTGTIRMEIPAESEDEARLKGMSFIISKTKVKIDSCENKATKEWRDNILKGAAGGAGDMSAFFDLLGKK